MTEASCNFSYEEFMLGVIFDMKHQSSVNGIGNFGPLYFYCLFAPPLP